MQRLALALSLLALGCPHQRDRGACSDHTQCKPGYACAPWGRCSDTCTTASQCLPGEECAPAAGNAGDGTRWCAVRCDPKDRNACADKLDHYGSRTVCRHIDYPYAEGVNGHFCADPSNGWGTSGNDPEAADESGG